MGASMRAQKVKLINCEREKNIFLSHILEWAFFFEMRTKIEKKTILSQYHHNSLHCAAHTRMRQACAA